jgi:phosphatidyl-N-methylethanolamine N-methyltransferase
LSFWILLGAAAALSLERACYVWVARAPGQFRRWCARPAVAMLGEPVAIVRRLFYGFKVVQFTVFGGWCYLHGAGSLTPADSEVIARGIGAALVLAGQALNATVFYRLGSVGVFYGDRLGYEVPWCRGFPFSVLSHPQYVGTVLSIWGFFVAMRFPHDDWVLLPVLETVYYAVGTHLEEGGGRATVRPGTSRLPDKPTAALGQMTPARRWAGR